MDKNNYSNILGKNIKVSGIEKSYDSLSNNVYIGYEQETEKIVYLLSENIKNPQVIAVMYDTVDGTEKLIAVENGMVMLEPDIREKIKENFDSKYFCLYEKTCGSIVYIVKNCIKHYLLVENDSGHIGFPKGHVEYGESEIDTARREVFEETGLKINIDPKTRQEYTYTTKTGIIKNCVYFYSEFKEELIKLQSEEIVRCWLVPYEEAYMLLNYPQDKVIFQKADMMYE